MPVAAKTMAERVNFAVERIGDGSKFASLQPEWNQLLKSGASQCLFLTWEWLYTWWKHLAADRQLAILAVRCAGELTALAPFCIRPPSLSRRCPFPVLEFLGSGSVGSDYLDFIVHKDCEPEALKALASYLSCESLVFDWAQLNRYDCLAADVAIRLREKGWRVSETRLNICPVIPLSGKSWDSYLATLGAEHRYNFNRKWKRLNKDYVVQFERVRTEDQCREAIDLLITLHNLRWSERGGSEAFQEGAEEYDLLHGNEDYKSHWSCDSRELVKLRLYPPGNLGWFYRSSAEVERASRTIARRLLPKNMIDGIRTRLNARQG